MTYISNQKKKFRTKNKIKKTLKLGEGTTKYGQETDANKSYRIQ